jgi:hypothetical protein
VKTKRHNYQIQFACFECRKAFKQSLSAENPRAIELSKRISGRKPQRTLPALSHTCPQCGGLLTLMGRAFRAPRCENVSQWHKVEILARNGFTFWSHVGRYPDSVREAEEFVKTKRKRSQGEILAGKIQRKSV